MKEIITSNGLVDIFSTQISCHRQSNVHCSITQQVWQLYDIRLIWMSFFVFCSQIHGEGNFLSLSLSLTHTQTHTHTTILFVNSYNACRGMTFLHTNRLRHNLSNIKIMQSPHLFQEPYILTNCHCNMGFCIAELNTTIGEISSLLGGVSVVCLLQSYFFLHKIFITSGSTCHDVHITFLWCSCHVYIIARILILFIEGQYVHITFFCHKWFDKTPM